MSKQWYDDNKKRIIAILTAPCFICNTEGVLEFIDNRYGISNPAFILQRVITGYTKRGCLHAHDYFRSINYRRIAIAIFQNEPLGDYPNNDIDINYSFYTNYDIENLPVHGKNPNALVAYNDKDNSNFDSEPFAFNFQDSNIDRAIRERFVNFYRELVKEYDIYSTLSEKKAVMDKLQKEYLNTLPKIG